MLKNTKVEKLLSIDELEIFCAYKNQEIPSNLEDETIIVFDSHTIEMDQKYYGDEFNWLINYTFK